MSNKLVDLTGQRFGRLVVLKREKNHVYPGGQQHVMWLVRCDCGVEFIVRGVSLKNGFTKSCGCLREEVARRKAKAGIRGGKANAKS